MVPDPSPISDAWTSFVDGLRAAGDRTAADATDLGEVEQADAFRALLRAVNNLLGRFEVDRERPELVAFNGWREKMFMDNPDFRYWVADIRDDRRYRITGAVGDALFQSVTLYSASGRLDATAAARIDSDSMTIDEDGRFTLTIGRVAPAEGGDWLEMPEGASALWVRQFHHDARREQLGWCHIETLDEVAVPPVIDPDRFAHQLERLARGIGAFPAVVSSSVRDDLAHPNEVRHWSEMVGGAAFTEPGIHYLRGAWELADGEALVLEGELVPCRYWNVLLYSRSLNSLDYRSRPVSRAGGPVGPDGGRYRIVISGTDPGGPGEWLDSEGRRFGLFVFRFLHPERTPELPSVRRCRITELRADP